MALNLAAGAGRPILGNADNSSTVAGVETLFHSELVLPPVLEFLRRSAP